MMQDGFYGDSSSSVTVPSVLLVVSSLGITGLFALGPGKSREAAAMVTDTGSIITIAEVGVAYAMVCVYIYP